MKTATKQNAFYVCLGLDAFFEGGRLFAGATSAAFLLSQGLSLSQVALLKSVQAIIIMFCDVPTGIFADTHGRKRSLMLSLLVAIAGFSLYYVGHGFLVFALAEALVALSLCFWSGAYEAFAIEAAHLESEPGLIDRYFHLNQAINSGAVMMCGLLGGYLGLHGLGRPYLGAVLVLLFAIAFLSKMTDEAAAPAIAIVRVSMATKLKTAIGDGLLSKRLMPFFIANIAIQFAIQPLLNYWQLLFQGFGPQVTSETLGWIFTIYCGTNLIFGAVAARYSKTNLFRSHSFSAVLFALFGAAYFAVGATSSFAVALAAFCLMQGFLSVARTALGVRFNENLNGLPRASILSSLSLISRLGMVSALGALSVGVKVAGPHPEPLLYMIFGAFAFFVSATAAIRLRSRTVSSPIALNSNAYNL